MVHSVCSVLGVGGRRLCLRGQWRDRRGEAYRLEILRLTLKLKQACLGCCMQRVEVNIVRYYIG